MASDSPSEIIGIDAFVQTPEHLPNTVFKFEKQEAAADLPLHVDREWIMRRVREQTGEEGHTIEPTLIDTKNGIGPFFYTLPQELRDMIFAGCLASGYPQFMASSRAMRQEGFGQIWKKGVLRMNFGFMDRMNPGSNLLTGTSECLRLTHAVANNIQNLSVRIKAKSPPCGDFWSSMDLSILRLFGGSGILRRSCTILIQLRRGPNRVGIRLLDILKTFVGFKNVELRFVADVKTFPKESLEGREKIIIEAYESEEETRSLLLPNLGFASPGWDEGGFFMTFHPRDPR